MTRQERVDPAVIDGGRRKRIATGSGTTIQEVNQLLRQFKEAQQLMRSPGMLGGMLGGGRGGRAAQALSDQMGDLAGLGPAGADPLGDLRTGLPSGSSPMRGLGGGGSKSTKGSKKKKGGRVTPKASGGGR